MPHITANGIEIFYDMNGPEDGKPILLISGVGTQMTRYTDSFIATLAGRGYRVIRMDNRDIGLSQKFTQAGVPDFKAIVGDMMAAKTPQVPYHLDDMAADAAALLDALGIEAAHIVGSSMGGMIVQLMAADHPHKVLSMTSIMSTTGNPALPRATEEAMAVLTTPRPDAGKDREAYIASGIKTAKVIGSPAFPIADADLRAAVEADLERSYHPTGFARQYAAILANGDRRAKLQTITCPVAVVHGVQDPLVPVDGGRDTAAVIEGAVLVEIDGMGHNIPPQINDRVADGIEQATLRA